MVILRCVVSFYDLLLCMHLPEKAIEKSNNQQLLLMTEQNICVKSMPVKSLFRTLRNLEAPSGFGRVLVKYIM